MKNKENNKNNTNKNNKKDKQILEKINERKIKNIEKIKKNINKYNKYIKNNNNKKIKTSEIIKEIYNDIKKIKKVVRKKNKLKIETESKKIYEKIITGKLNKNKYIKTRIKNIDRIITGLHNGDTIIIAGRPSSGKTALCLNICKRISIDSNKKTFIISMEMSKEQIITRLFGLTSKINLEKINKSKLNKEEKKRIKKAYEKIKKSEIFINDNSSFKKEKFEKELKKISKKKKVDLIIIDYIQLIHTKKTKENRNQEISDISRYLKKTSRKLKVPIIIVSQLNRNIEQRINKRPMMSDLRDSGSLEQDSDIIIFINKKNEKDNNIKNKKENIEITIEKNRNGKTGKTTLEFLSKTTMFK